AGCGDVRIEEYRVGFTARNSNDVYYGCVWPLYGRDEETPGEDQPDTVDEIAALLKEYGVHDLRRIPGVLPPEYCEDCDAPLFPNPMVYLVHAELPEDDHSAPAQFHWARRMMRGYIFCRVIDDFGDIGVCWRLARRVAHGRGCQVRLWVAQVPA